MSFGKNSPESSHKNHSNGNNEQIYLTTVAQNNKALFVNKRRDTEEALSHEGKLQVLSKMKFLLANDNSVK